MVIIIEKSFVFCSAWYFLFTENLFLTMLLYSMSIAFSLQNIVKNNAYNHLVLFSLCWNLFLLMHNCKSWYVVCVIFIPWSSFFHFLTWTHVPCFFTSNYPQAHSIQSPGAFFPLLEPFFVDAQLLVLVCCLCYFYSLIVFFLLSNLDWCPMFFTSNYPQAHSIQSPGAFFLCWNLFSLMHNC